MILIHCVLKRRRKRGRQKKQRHQQRRYPKNASSNHFILKDEARPKIWQKESCVHTLKYARFSIDSVTRLFKTTRFCFIENSINSFFQNLMVFNFSNFLTVFENHKKVSFNIASEASYIYTFSGQKFIKI